VQGSPPTYQSASEITSFISGVTLILPTSSGGVSMKMAEVLMSPS
jgi:hypothetical protein